MQSMSIEHFLDQLASAEPTPGGGAAAGVMGAMGMGLIAMVARVTLGKKGQEAWASELEQQVQESDRLRQHFAAMISEDARAFEALMQAFKLPKDSVEAIDHRASTIQRGYEGATEVPLACMRACLEGLLLARRSAELGHRNVLSDTGVAVHALMAAFKSAVLNVEINVPAIRDAAFVAQAQQAVVLLTRQAEEEAAVSLEQVARRLA